MICFNSFWDLGSLEDVSLRLLSAYLEAHSTRILRNFANGTYLVPTYYNSDLHEDSYYYLEKNIKSNTEFLGYVFLIHSLFFNFFLGHTYSHLLYSAPSGAWDRSLKCIYPFFRCMLAKILSNDYMQYLKCTFWSRLLNIK